MGSAFPCFKRSGFFIRLTVVLFLFSGMHTYASVFSQTKMTLKLEQAELKQALKIIEKNSEFRFLYNEEVLKNKGKVDIDVKNAAVAEILNILLKSRSISYKFLANNLVVLNNSGSNMPVDIRVSGKILDGNGAPIIGASVQIKGSTVGTAADTDGSYSLTAPDNATLIFSAVGFASQELPVNGRTTINVVLVPGYNSLEDVVVVGYGTQKKRDLTGSITSIKGEEIERLPNTNPIASLQGKVAGLTVSNSGSAGGAPVVRIRGINSTNSASPVYVVDGVLQDDINYLSQADIESIDVLRDPSSIAIYGMRAANGVIAITTKRAAKGKTTINVQSLVGIQRVQDRIDVVDAAGFRRLYDAQLANINAQPFDYTNYTANTNWQDLVLRDAVLNNNNINIASSTEKSSTVLNVGYTNQQGVLRNDQFERFLMRLNQEMTVNEHIKVGGNINGYFTRDNPPGASVINALRAAPIVPVRDGDNFYSMPSFQRAQVGNPIGNLFRNDRNSVNQTFRVVGSLFAEVKFLKNFTWRSTLYTNLVFNSSRSYSPLANTVIDLGEGTAPTVTFRDNTVRTSVAQSKSESRAFQQDHTLAYGKRFGVHSINATAGFTTIYNYGSSINGNRRDTSVNIPDDPNFWYLNVSPNFMPGTYGGSGFENSVAGGFARLNYGYEDKYLLNATIRRDGSSKFAPKNRWGTFGSIGVGWVMSDEKFFQNVDKIDFLKLRAAWGTVGNSNGIPDFIWIPGLSNASTAVFGENAFTSVQAAYIVDEDVKFEVVNGLDVGVDLKAFNNRLDVGITYYDRRTKDILTGIVLPSDGRSFFSNLGEVSNKGIEIALGWNDEISKDFRYSISANMSYNRNRVESIGDNFNFTLFGNGGVNRTITGFDIGHFFGFTQTGIYQSTADLARQPSFANSLPGDISYADIDGNGVINQDDRQYLGTPFPPYSFGGAINLQYKNFDFAIEGQGFGGNKIYTQRRNANFAVLNYESNRLNAWTGPGTSNVEPILDNSRGNNYQFSTYFLEPGDFFRIRTLQVGYNFSREFLNTIGFKQTRVFVSAQNLKTWSRATGYSPEPQIGSILGGGADNGAYPVPAVYSFGVNLTF